MKQRSENKFCAEHLMILPIERMETNKHIFSISIHTTNRVGKERCFVYQLDEHTIDVYVDNILFISTEEACQRSKLRFYLRRE